MTDLFLQILNMSISAGYIVLAVILLRMLMKKAPKWISVVLWGVVGLRLVCPFSINSIFSLIPSPQTISPDIMTNQHPTINSGIPILNSTINPIIGESFAPEAGASVNPLQILVPAITFVWTLGIVVMLVYTAISYLKIKQRINTAVLLYDNIFQSENVSSPFVLGIIKPKIYLPFNMKEGDMNHVIAHEKAHILRKDHLWKPLGFLLLAIHWFNPLMWLGYILLCRDIELACDEKVIKKLDRESRADYSEALISCSVNRRMITACPLAFGEMGVKKRIKSILNYKRPAFWIVICGIVICIAVAVCFLTDPINKEDRGIYNISAEIVTSNIIDLVFEYDNPRGSYGVDTVPYDYPLFLNEDQELNSELEQIGKYRILVKFDEQKPSESFKAKYPDGEIIEMENSPFKIRFKYEYSEDNGFQVVFEFEDPVVIMPVQEKLSVFSDSVEIPVKVLKYSSEKFIHGFVPSPEDTDILNYIYVQDYGCENDNSDIVFKEFRNNDGKLEFDILWKNISSDPLYLGYDFQLYKYSDDKLVKLEDNGILYDGAIVILGHSEYLHSYNITIQYGSLEAGKYRFEADGSWVDFNIINGSGYVFACFDSKKFDIDGDGIDEICSLRHGYTSGLFTFVFLVQNQETLETEYETLIYLPPFDLSFKICDDGKVRVQGVSLGDDPQTHIFDISIERGEVILSERVSSRLPFCCAWLTKYKYRDIIVNKKQIYGGVNVIV